MKKSTVSVVRVSPEADYEAIREGVRKAIDLAGGWEGVVEAGDLVLIKPNVLAPSAPGAGACTNPLVCRAIADLVRERGARAVIAESSAVGVDTEKAYASMGYDALREQGYEVVDLKKGKPARLEVPDGYVISEFATWELVTQADAIISVPVLKTHDQAEMTLSLKNLKGLESDKDKKALHKVGIFKGVADLASALKPAMTVIDGLTGQEGLGPLYGIPVQMGLLLASRDLVAADTVAAAIADFAPDEMGISVFAAQKGLGTMDMDEIEVAGEPVDRVRRRFLRCSEDKRVQIDGLRIMHAPGTCTGCRNTMLSVVFDMKNADQAQYLSGLTIVTGPGTEMPSDVPPESVIVVGICAPEELRKGRFVTGCPPNNVAVVQEILGGKVQAKRTYATEGAAQEDLE